MSYRYEIQVGGNWYPNQVHFATESEASLAGYNKHVSWTMSENYRVVPSDEPVNYRWDPELGPIHIATAD